MIELLEYITKNVFRSMSIEPHVVLLYCYQGNVVLTVAKYTDIFIR